MHQPICKTVELVRAWILRGDTKFHKHIDYGGPIIWHLDTIYVYNSLSAKGVHLETKVQYFFLHRSLLNLISLNIGLLQMVWGIIKIYWKKIIATQTFISHRCKEHLKKFSFIPYESSIFALFLALHTSGRYSTLSQIFCNKGGSIFAALFVFGPSSCSGLQALAERMPHLSQSPTEKSRGGDQIWRSRREGSGPPPRPIHRSGNCPFKNVVTSVWMCGGAPSCWKTTFGLSWDSWGINHNANMWH
jgi:hypothetical protein